MTNIEYVNFVLFSHEPNTVTLVPASGAFSSVAITKYSIKKRKTKRLYDKWKICLNVACKHQSQWGFIQNNPISVIVVSLLAKTLYL